MKTLIGLLSVLTGSFLAIIGLLGAMGSALTLKLLPGRGVEEIAQLPERSTKSAGPKYGAPRVVVRGTVAAGPGGTYRSPLSDQECVWYLATQTVVDGGRRATVDRFAPLPFTLSDAEGHQVLVGPHCPALDQLSPSFRESRPDPHPWFDEAPELAGGVAPGTAPTIEVYEFVLTDGADLLAAGDLGSTPSGAPVLGGEVTLSAGGDAAAAGDPAKRRLPRDLGMALAGLVLIVMGAVTLSYVDEDDYDDDQQIRPGFSTPQ
ncbi:hypothetical protein [Sporichthya sp.]|uniref:hypothetical protein n=1 Tax=Sporichthya sp. TaxID=65475 RepID=UPI001840D13B|nr:hypothetical protein [Sporichthya sp.]MBA3744722.1 hypothetical protein [Sporichthya sp.]